MGDKMVEKYAMLSNVKSIKLATLELKKKIEQIQKLRSEIEYLNKVKKEKEDEIKKKLKQLNEKIKQLHMYVEDKKKKSKK